MNETELRAKVVPLSAEMMQVWMDMYEAVRGKGLSERAARDLVNAVTSPETMQMWLQVYEIARASGLSEQMAMQYANTAIPSIREEYVKADRPEAISAT
jgi:hypothetical protein